MATTKPLRLWWGGRQGWGNGFGGVGGKGSPTNLPQLWFFKKSRRVRGASVWSGGDSVPIGLPLDRVGVEVGLTI